MATNSADYCMLFNEWASSKLIRLEVDIGSVLESEFGLKWSYGPLCILKVVSRKPIPYKVKVAFSKQSCRARGGPPGPNHGLFTVKPSSHHMHSTLRLTPPTSYPTLSAEAEPAGQHAETIFSVQCAV